ncbi:MAG: hypothetical protein DI586_10610 [Micavibrio aeruginosavorus]|uniref:Uncharacterized protein n=1 Tax=Micavibrio aeruginosavorus TaxID=349221 RepID=A0A2W5FJD8_9BACT|nr:MAG: hypothetical protein DI586_10610 [Micavibrio aeruginosavorus]
MKHYILAAASALIFTSSLAMAQSEPDYQTAINMHNLFQKQCFDKMPHIEKIRDEARVGNWVVGPLNNSKPVSWAVNEGMDNFSIMVVDSVGNSSKTCEVRGKTSEATAVSVFNGIYADQIKARRTGAPENSWTTPNGTITIQPANDGRTSVILSK